MPPRCRHWSQNRLLVTSAAPVLRTANDRASLARGKALL